ncbi:HU family DNA-binding protein [Nitrosovibrio sp. Nv6]|uniref:HU family DNA-binding protein n=1 Tax=Nitrosovibrio sp. Nv6 TaxID=1855340 RepID=UPI0008AFDDC0|nr:HU family DNA-binding protein [Nitrosovibrio sp. Nv6]SEP23504.1 DNA-binding protein HU-beta [Nitrosovibrio sp. Nv6]
MNKRELVDAMAAKTGGSKAETERAIGALIEVISDTLKKGDSLSLPGFGSFEVRERPARIGRNPRTGEELKIAASRVPAFKPGATLKAAVNGNGR